MDRPDALRYIATHIGHSRKRSLSPQDRLTLMTQGQYGIGLLGFWSLGERLEIRSSIPGQKPHRLVLYRDRPTYKIEPLRGKLAFEDHFTEVVVVDLSRDASAAVGARRAADYLAAELRGQLLGRKVDVVVEDRIARGRAPKLLRVRPPRFLGERLEGLGPVEIEGHAPVKLEFYLTSEYANGDPSPPLALYAAGTIVAESFFELSALGLDREPWTDTRLTGMVDFADLHVAPGSRRGVIPDAVARAFAEALTRVEPLLQGILETKERERAEKLDQNTIRDLQRAFRDFYRKRPSYTMLPTETKSAGTDGGGPGAPAAEPDVEAPPVSEAIEAPELFPPGPLETVSISPRRILLEASSERAVTARPMDGAGRRIRGGVELEWEVFGHAGSIRPDPESPARVTFLAAESPGEAILSVHARETSSGNEASAAAPVEVVDLLETSSSEGIPEPELVDAPGAPWRSRFHQERWQVNTGHPDYKASSERPTLKLRYLAMLFSKEVVLRSSQDPRLEAPLEQMVEVAAYADRKLTERAPRGRRGVKPVTG
jgi:hypothetical protein